MRDVWNAAKGLITGKYIALNIYTKKELKSIIQTSTITKQKKMKKKYTEEQVGRK